MVAALIVLLGIEAWFLFHDLRGVPANPISDHAEEMLDMRDLIQGRHAVFFTRNLGNGPLHFYWTVFLVKGLGLPLRYQTLKTATALFGLLLVPAFYLLGAEMGGAALGLATAAFGAWSKWPVSLARQGVEYIYPTPLTAIVLWALLRYVRRGDRTSVLAAGAALGVGLHTYLSFRIVPLLVPLAVVAALFDRRRRGRRWSVIGDGGLVAGTSAILFLPVLKFAFFGTLPQHVLVPDREPRHLVRARPGRVAAESLRREPGQHGQGVPLEGRVDLDRAESRGAVSRHRGRGAVDRRPRPRRATRGGAVVALGGSRRGARRADAAEHAGHRLPQRESEPESGRNGDSGRVPARRSRVRTRGAGPVERAPRAADDGHCHPGLGSRSPRRASMPGRTSTSSAPAYSALIEHSMEIAEVIRRNAANGIPIGQQYLLAVDYWVDGRNIALDLGDPKWADTNNIVAPKVPELTARPLAFVYRSTDTHASPRSRGSIREGTNRLMPQSHPDRNFSVYVVR